MAPIVGAAARGELIGVIQIINNKAGVPFGALAEEGVAELTQTLAIAFKQRQKPQLVKTKYDYLIADAVLSAGEFELASRQARKKAVDVEQVLVEEFQVKIPAIGAALSKFFGVPYEAFKPDRVKPMDLLKNLKREYVESNQWLPIDDTKEGLVVLCLDPERIRSSRIASNVFPKARLRLQGDDAEGVQGHRQPVLRRRGRRHRRHRRHAVRAWRTTTPTTARWKAPTTRSPPPPTTSW